MFGNLTITDKVAIKEMLESNEKVQIDSRSNEWIELVKTPSAHFSHAISSIAVEKEMEYLEAYEEEAKCY
jgi:hypothetical protein